MYVCVVGCVCRINNYVRIRLMWWVLCYCEVQHWTETVNKRANDDDQWCKHMIRDIQINGKHANRAAGGLGLHRGSHCSGRHPDTQTGEALSDRHSDTTANVWQYERSVGASTTGEPTDAGTTTTADTATGRAGQFHLGQLCHGLGMRCGLGSM